MSYGKSIIDWRGQIEPTKVICLTSVFFKQGSFFLISHEKIEKKPYKYIHMDRSSSKILTTENKQTSEHRRITGLYTL